jgi:hypothetical protein
MAMAKRILSAMTLLLAAAPAVAANGALFFSFDTYNALICAEVPCHCTNRMFVWAVLQGASQTGITGAEYRIETGPNNLPDPGWLFVETFEPGLTVLGTGALNPPDGDHRGVTLAWPSCQSGDGIKVLIETVDIFNADCAEGTLQLRGARRDPATNPFFQCPLFVLCDAPTYTKVCLGFNITQCQNPEPPFPMNATCSTSGIAYLNPQSPYFVCGESPPDPSDCKVAATPESWSRVKALYRD